MSVTRLQHPTELIVHSLCRGEDTASQPVWLLHNYFLLLQDVKGEFDGWVVSEELEQLFYCIQTPTTSSMQLTFLQLVCDKVLTTDLQSEIVNLL